MRFGRIGLPLLLGACLARPVGASDWHVLVTSDASAAAASLLVPLEGGRYVAAELQTLTREKSGDLTPRTIFTYAFDCAAPVGLKVLAMSFNRSSDGKSDWFRGRPDDLPENFKLNELEYVELTQYQADMAGPQERAASPKQPQTLPLLARFACSAGAAPEHAAKVANELARTGGLDDITDLLCRFEGSSGRTAEGRLRFSEKADLVQWNDRWRQTGAVTPDQVRFDLAPGVRAVVSRHTGETRLESPGTSAVARGTCDRAVRKF